MKISVIIPTWNESEKIVHLIKFIQDFGGSDVAEILVVDSHSTDETFSLAKHAGAIVLVSPVRSRAVQMNTGARHATGDILYMLM